MAEVGTVIALVQIADRVIGLCTYWIGAIRDAPADLRFIFLETSMLQTIFKQIEFLTKCDNTASAAFESLSRLDGPLDRCHRTLSNLVDLIPDGGVRTNDASSSTREKVTAMAARLAWPFKEPKARKLLEELGRHKTTITLALTAESTQDVKYIKEKATGMYDMLTESQRNDFCQWLQSTDPSPLHNRSRKLVEDGTCNWVLRLPEWADWLAARIRCLWIHGIPGAGKTVLASYLIDKVASHCHDNLGPTCATLYYYCYFGHDQDESGPLLRWLITQLCRQTEAVPTDIYTIFKQRCDPSLPKLLDALETMLNSFQTVYVVVDAVDESKRRGDLLKILRDLGTDPRFSQIQLLMTSREYLDIETVLGEISKPVSMSNSFVEHDIQHYVRSRLQINPKFQRWNSQLCREVETTLSTRAKGMFRWVVCQLDRLQRMRGESQIRQALVTLPRTLDETYERIFLEIPDEERAFVRMCLRWIHFHNEQHHNSIPCDILLRAIELNIDEQNEVKNDCPYDEQDLKEICGCLVHVTQGRAFKTCLVSRMNFDETISVVSLAHYTVREFLDSDRISASTAAFFMLEKQIHVDIQRTILLVALELRASDFENLSLKDDYEVADHEAFQADCFRSLTSNFRIYCVVSAMFSISSRSTEILGHQDLRNHVFCILDPSGPHAMAIMDLLMLLKDSLDLLSENDRCHDLSSLNSITAQWLFTNRPSQSQECAMFLFSILIFANDFEPLAQGLFQRIRQSPDFMHTPLHFRMKLWANYEEIWCEFDGRMIEFFAEAPGELEPGKRLEFILNQNATLHDPTAVLYSYLARYRDDEDNPRDPRLLNRLLELGCDPNGTGYTITPLQIAVAAFNFVEVETLLRAGADPNNMGNPDGVQWTGLFGDFECLEGTSALYICQDCTRMSLRIFQDGPQMFGSQDEQEMLEALLIEYGARSFTAVKNLKEQRSDDEAHVT